MTPEPEISIPVEYTAPLPDTWAAYQRLDDRLNNRPPYVRIAPDPESPEAVLERQRTGEIHPANRDLHLGRLAQHFRPGDIIQLPFTANTVYPRPRRASVAANNTEQLLPDSILALVGGPEFAPGLACLGGSIEEFALSAMPGPRLNEDRLEWSINDRELISYPQLFRTHLEVSGRHEIMQPRDVWQRVTREHWQTVWDAARYALATPTTPNGPATMMGREQAADLTGIPNNHLQPILRFTSRPEFLLERGPYRDPYRDLDVIHYEMRSRLAIQWTPAA